MNLRNRRISTDDFMEISRVVTFTNEAILSFVEGGWAAGEQYPSRWLELKGYLRASQRRYHSATIGTARVTAGTVAGRILVTFEWADNQITIIGGEDEPDRGAGLHSIDASMEDVREMFGEVISKWDIAAFSPNDKAMIV